MRPIRQTRFGEHDGNCFEACIASLLMLRGVDEVPRYAGSNHRMNEYLLRLDEWLRQFGKAIVCFVVHDQYPYEDKPDVVGDDTSWIGSFATTPGASFHHAVVMEGRRPRWDPQTGEEWPDLRAPLRAATLLLDRR